MLVFPSLLWGSCLLACGLIVVLRAFWSFSSFEPKGKGMRLNGGLQHQISPSKSGAFFSSCPGVFCVWIRQLINTCGVHNPFSQSSCFACLCVYGLLFLFHTSQSNWRQAAVSKNTTYIVANSPEKSYFVVGMKKEAVWLEIFSTNRIPLKCRIYSCSLYHRS